MTVAACILDCLAKEVRDHSKTHRRLIVMPATYLSLRDLCQQEVMDEKGSALATVVAISNLGSCGIIAVSIQRLTFTVRLQFRLLRSQ
jgi:hypothetical protein